MTSEHPLVALAYSVQCDLTAAKAKLAEIQRQIAALNLAPPGEHACDCGVAFGSAFRLAEHRYTSHNGPEPAHWVESEARSVEPDDDVAAAADAAAPGVPPLGDVAEDRWTQQEAPCTGFEVGERAK